MADITKALENAGNLVRDRLPNCPVCEGMTWETGRLDGHELRLTPDRIGGTPPPPPKYVYVDCANCGYSHTFRTERVAEYYG